MHDIGLLCRDRPVKKRKVLNQIMIETNKITKGYIRRVDNPGVVQQMMSNLEASGVPSSDISGILEALREAFSRDIAVWSLRDGEVVLDASRTRGKALLNILGIYNALKMPSSVLKTSVERRRSGYTISPGRTETYMTALKYFLDGYPTTKATKAAGCSYPSFRYWYQNNYTDYNQ